MNPLRRLWSASGSALVGALALAGTLSPAQAQSSAGSSPVAAQAGTSSDSMALNAALARLGRNPRDVAALIDAGNAALAIGDVDASIGFFSRANQVTPGSPLIKAALARALVRSGNPYDAIPLFEEAERGGAMDSTVALDRGLAYDLVADNASAQRFYRLALTSGPNDEALRRLAISQAIAGDKRGSAATLAPLLMRQDKAAWRARAFSLAILGQGEDAVAVVNTSLPPALASGLTPYLRYMPRLTRSQQAAAANFGQFPRAAQIGQDDPRMARYAGAPARGPAVVTNDAGLVPRGEPLGRSAQPRDAARPAARVPVPSLALRPAPVPAVAAAPQVRRDPPRLPPPEPQPARQPVPAPIAAATPMLPAQPSLARTYSMPPSPAAPVAQAVRARPAPIATAAPPPPTPTRRPTLSEAFSDLARPSIDMAPERGAVDIRRIKPAREAFANAAAAKPPPPSHASRIWVQIATGRDKAALGFDWRRMNRQGETVLKGKRSYISGWGQTNRLLTGPFDTEAAASSFIAQLRRADIDGAFLWTSPAGQVVDALPAR